jgi:nitroreductase
MELFQAVKERYSYRGAFVQKPIPEADLRKIVQAGLDAPAARTCRPPSFSSSTTRKSSTASEGCLPGRPS